MTLRSWLLRSSSEDVCSEVGYFRRGCWRVLCSLGRVVLVEFPPLYSRSVSDIKVGPKSCQIKGPIRLNCPSLGLSDGAFKQHSFKAKLRRFIY